eukprot:TRINITY_DN3850_c0_g1_i2.p2 TRINITY_DN3850_c0_g1~~TRINITY_DN3850_c0_g1_i2.p2  ORF type:complete len:123 (-),score=25.16 TRINITY_DN3850_c0_g1_i2:38-406(-)
MRQNDGRVTEDVLFAFAHALSHSQRRVEQEQAIALLTQLCKRRPDDVSFLYSLSLALLRSGNLPECRQTVEKMLKLEPENHQARALHALALERISRDGAVGFGLVLALGAVAMFAVSALARK